MTARSRKPQNSPRPSAFWPHAGLLAGLVLSSIGVLTNQTQYLIFGGNLMTISGMFLSQRRRNARRDTHDEDTD